jgi:preprotein translocase subunit SecD
VIGRLAILSAVAMLGASNSTIVLKTVSPSSDPKLRATVEILRARLARLGTRASIARGLGSAVITITLRDVADPVRVARLLVTPGRFEIYDLEADLAPLSLGPDGVPVAHTRPLRARKGTVQVMCGRREFVCPGVLEAPPLRTYYYLFKHEPELTNMDLRLPAMRQDVDPTTTEPVVLIQFTAMGRKKFKNVTQAEARRGRQRGALQHVAMVLDGELKSFASIDYTQYPDGIDPINGAQITGIRSVGEARDLAVLLGTPPLPVRLVVVRASPL